VQCGGTASLVHPVDVVARTRATVVIDAQLDAAIVMDDATPTLRYASVSLGRPRLASDLAVLGRALGAQRAYAVIASQDRVVVVDVGTSTEVGESPVTDGSRLRALLTQPVAVAPALASRTHATENTQSGSGSTPHASIVVRRGGVPASAIVLGALGLVSIGAGAFSLMEATSAGNRAEQAQDPMTRLDATHEQRNWQIGEIVGFAAGGSLVLTGLLIGILARPSEEATVHVSAMPLSGGGGWAGVGGRF
jgi:hypothetical protein